MRLIQFNISHHLHTFMLSCITYIASVHVHTVGTGIVVLTVEARIPVGIRTVIKKKCLWLSPKIKYMQENISGCSIQE